MNMDEARQRLQRRLMVAQTSEVPADAIDAIAALIVDIDREAREPGKVLAAIIGNPKQ